MQPNAPALGKERRKRKEKAPKGAKEEFARNELDKSDAARRLVRIPSRTRGAPEECSDPCGRSYFRNGR
jgi:hypothetical protein